ncbi:hypothetical protein [Thalassospira australica]|uniref:hypothetical protein n=1 Tax=Thalassospira australica TaxID=1528106 RepID=UPI00384B830D
MSFGSGKLDVSFAQEILEDEKHKDVVSGLLDGSVNWYAEAAKPLKDELRVALRQASEERCVYCRRIPVVDPRTNASEHVEHFLDKSKEKYKRFIVSPFNLSISCNSCNIQKKTKDMLLADIDENSIPPTQCGQYHWLHPCYDDYFENIQIDKGWVYSIKHQAPAAAAAKNLIDECRLIVISEIEERKNAEVDSVFDEVLECMLNWKDDPNSTAEKVSSIMGRAREEVWKNI